MTPQCVCNNGFIMNCNEEAALMENRNSVAEERGPPSTERGVLYLWQSGSSSDGPLIDRVLLSRPVIQAALGAYHGLILTQGGMVYTFGELTWRRGLVVPASSPLIESSLCGHGVVRVAAGGFHCAALSEQGGVFTWGENAAGQCGLTGRERDSCCIPPQEDTDRGPLFVAEASPVCIVDSDVVPPLGVRVVDVSCGREHTLAVSAQQEVWSWGSGCQLGLVTKTFPVWKPRKVEHLAGRHVIQVACGDFHSLALVRSLPPQNHNTHNASERQSGAPLAASAQRSTPLAAKRKELVEVEDSHYCPLGVELVETTPLKGSSQKSSPRTKLWTRGRSATPSPLSSRSQTPNTTTINTTPSSSTEPNPPMAAGLGPDVRMDSSPTAGPPTGWRSNKNSSFPDEVELQDFFQRLSIRSQDGGDVNHIGGAGDSASLTSHSGGAGDSASLTSHTSDDSQSSLAEGSSYEDDCPVIRNTPLCVLSSSAPARVEDMEEEQEGRCKKKKTTSCLMDLSYEERPGGHRTHSLPRLRSHAGGSPLSRRLHAARGEGPGAELPSLETEVWSWGRGLEGQLGHADHLPRLQPLCIDSLTGEEVVKIVAGSHHSMALTARCQVFSWGSNISGQLGHLNTPVTVPHQIKLSEGLHVWDVSAGHAHSLLLVDADCVQPIIYYCGQTQGGSGGQVGGQRSPKGQSRSPYKAETYAVGPRPLPACMEMGYISSVSSGGQCCASLAEQNRDGLICTLHELVSRERRHYCLLRTVHTTVLLPLVERDSVCRGLAEPCGRLFSCVTDSFVRLSVLTGRNAAFLTSFLRDSGRRDVTSFPLLDQASLFLDAYKEFSASVGNFQVMSGFQTLHKLSVDAIGRQVRQVCVEDKSSSSGDVALMSLFYQPIRHLQQYARLLLKLAHSYDVSTPEYRSLHQGSCQYECLSVSLSRRRREAEATQLLWKSSSGKSTDCLREPERRLVADSSNGRSLTLLNAGRFSVNSFLLFNDVLVHTQYSSHHIYPLTTLWVKPVTEDDTAVLNALKVTLPEESFTLVASTPQEKNKWLHALSQAVEQTLGVVGQGSSGVAAACRSASYTFRGDGKLRDATYTGGWMSGRMHGRGAMKWPDGRSYNGNFKNGLEDGYGEGSLGQKEHYVGHWKEGRIHGYGRYRYANGEVYEGCFNEGHRHGYGMLSSGRQAKASSCVFIGQWVHDRKTGYGVHDDITKGERYMGLWSEDQRQGSGVVLTQFGRYFEGTFRDNKMTGAGLLVCDDDTVFQGEFSDDWTISGKGLLSLPNGDNVDGLFSGEWSTGLKVTGTFTKINLHDVDNRPRKILKEVGGSAVRAAQKWQCVFEECWRRLGCGPTGDLNTAWSNIAVTITTARRESPQLSRSQIRVLEQLEFIPRHEEAVTAANYDTIPRYLAKACETPLHPLGWLVETLVTSYRMTYVGVGSNRRLLPQAVQEFQSYMTRLFNVVRFLFPGLPDEGYIISDGPPSPSADVDETTQQGCVVVSSSSLLHQVVLSRLYSPLFTLYCLEEERGEAAYWHTVMSLNKQPDQSLFSFLQVHQKFWPVSTSVLGEKKQIGSSSKDVCYVSAVESLQQISTTFTPSDKLLVIQRSFEELTQEVQALLSRDFLWSMDDLFPLFLYVVLRARIRNLGAEVSLIDDLMDRSLQHGELGHMFTTLKACYYQIQQEKA